MNTHHMFWIPLLICACGGMPEEAGSEADGEVTDTATSELVFGTVTSLRPEIGALLFGGSVSCTATLISPTAIVTAAHCFAPTSSNLTALPSSPQFRYQDLSGIQRVVSIDRVRSFNWDSFAPSTVGVPLTGDVAVAHLTTAVPASRAVPARISAVRPTTGAASTMFGVGCTDRIFQDAFGIKRIVTFSFGTGTTSLCPADSGGPEVFGGPASGGAVWGVSTGAILWYDTFADVAVHGPQIEAVLRGWDGRDELDTDRIGLDYFVQVASTVGVCRKGCEDDARCRAFSWRASDQLCWRKEGAPTPSPAAGIVSGCRPDSRQAWMDWGETSRRCRVVDPSCARPLAPETDCVGRGRCSTGPAS